MVYSTKSPHETIDLILNLKDTSNWVYLFQWTNT